MAPSNYTAKDITVLEGLEPVRKRPGMYIGGVGSSGLHHLIWEVLDNSVDEAMNGHASNIAVTLHENGSSITIEDDGRGIPVDTHPATKKSALEVIFTVLHAGGKFESGNYKTAGGLHGVGASVVNALSKDLVATVKRDGMQWEMRFKQGHPVGGLRKLGPARGSGTTVFFHPDAAIFPKIEFDPAIIKERLEVISYLHKGVKVVFEDESSKERLVFQHADGLVDYLKKIVGVRGAKPVHDSVFVLNKDDGMRLDFVLQWTEATDEHIRSYVNGIPTSSGGTHESGLRAGLGKAVRNFIETHALSPKGVSIIAEDIREGLVGVLSLFIQEPQFQGQTERSPQQSGDDVGGRRRGAPGARALAESQHQRGGSDRRADYSLGACSRSQPRRASRSVAQERHLRQAEPSGQAQRLYQPDERGQRDLHCRGRFGGRVGEAGARPRTTGDSPAARQGLEH